MVGKRARRLPLYALGAVAAKAASDYESFSPRNFTGEGNNIANPAWGAVGTAQVRAVADADYDDDGFTPPGSDRPSAREVMTGVFLSSTAAKSTKSALFVAWGQLLTYDLSLTVDNASEPFDVLCDDGLVDIWCPLGAESGEISFSRSDAAVANSVRSPVNYATAYVDLDFLYGRSEAEAEALRTLEGGLMNITNTGVPFQEEDGTWLMADQRPALFPVTFALHIMLLLEHNRCCVEVAPDLGFETDESIFQACRGRNIATFQHITENDFIIRLLGGSIEDLGLSFDATSDYSSEVDVEDDYMGRRSRRLRRRRGLSASRSEGVYFGGEKGLGKPPDDGKGENDAAPLDGGQGRRGNTLQQPHYGGLSESEATLRGEASAGAAGAAVSAGPPGRRRRLYSPEDYDGSVNAGVDVFALTAGGVALESAIPPTVRIVSEGYISTAEDNLELTVASEDIAGLFARNDVGNILRGAVLSPALAVDTYYSAAVSNLSPLFKLSIDAVQRGRDHGLPDYNTVREAYGLTAATAFSDITNDTDVAALLSAAYGGDIDNLDAFTGALAEDSSASTGGLFGELLFEAWSEQFYRSVAGDRLYHLHARDVENVALTTLSAVIERTTNVTDLPLSVFQAPGVEVCAGDCETVGEAEITLSDSFGVAWEVLDDDVLAISLRAKGIGEAGMLGIGWGGLTMFGAQDYVICEVLSADTAECIDRSYITSRTVPPPDLEDPILEVTAVSVAAEWTTVTFLRDMVPLDSQDYDLAEDFEAQADTEVIYAFREGSGVGQHPNANRGAATVNFATGGVETECDDNDFVPLHGALMLIAWMLIAPIGIYYARYRKGETVNWAGNEWYEMHEEIMIVAAEAVLPLGITAVFASGGSHDTPHAHWGYYMIAAVAVQILTGWMRTKGLEAKHANFSFLHRFNKHFHIWAGRFAYVAGVVQCYRGLELVSADDNLLFSAGDGLDLQLGSFGWVQDYMFPVWFALLALAFVVFESRKQYRRYFRKGTANLCGIVQIINEEYEEDARKEAERLMPRTEDLPLYTVTEFNDKVLNGQSWVLVDGAILDVSTFSQRHPGGARLILNAVGTDVTHELLGQDLSVGHAMSFTPHTHPQSAWEIARSLVIGYIEEDDEEDEEEDEKTKGEGRLESNPPPTMDKNRFRIAAKAVLLPASRMPLAAGDNMSKKAQRLNSLATIADPAEDAAKPTVAPGATTFGVSQSVLRSPADDVPRIMPAKRSWSNKRLLERFHVCPLLFRERMGASSAIGRGNLPSTRPVYRYIFSCPGQAEALAQAIAGVCYFNMRAQDGAKGVIQRSYNAFAVRVTDSAPGTPGGSVVGGGGTGAGTRRVIPAGQTTEGMLCIEMRIRLYPDGAMSKLLEKLAKDTDNPAVQLQGPFLIKKVIPPPAHRNVVMVAAGTGINPMMQVIRDYLALSGNASHSSRSRLALLWQSTSEADLFGAEEITAMQARSNGLLEVTVLISGEYRKRNVPGAAFRKAKDKLKAARQLISPISSSPSSSIIALPPGRRSKRNTIDDSGRGASESAGDLPPFAPTSGSRGSESKFVESVESQKRRPSRAHLVGTGDRSNISDASKLGPHSRRLPMQPKESSSPLRRLRRHRKAEPSDASDVGGGGLTRGKVSREILEKVFGTAVLAALATGNEHAGALTATGSGIRGESKRDVDAGGLDALLDNLCGTESTPGKLQVIVSGPSGFVFYVETLLAEMGVPSRAIVLLD